MSPARVFRLKRACGWFAAGREVQCAATVLSDAGFKLFVWLCMHAARDSGRLSVDTADLARSLRKTERDIDLCLQELARAGICRFTAPGSIEIRDRFWPYQRSPSQAVAADPEAYAAAVKRMFLRHGCVCSTFSPADERLADGWRRRGVSLEQVERAISLGVARKYVALVNNGSGTPITTLHYFAHLIDEVGQMNVSPDYWRYVIARTRQFESRWRSLHAASHPKSSYEEETK
jgi:hypothetical protein